MTFDVKPRILCAGNGTQRRSTQPLPPIGATYRFCSSCCAIARQRQKQTNALHTLVVQAQVPRASSLSQSQEEAIDRYLTFLLSENLKYNLTAVKDWNEAYDRHVLDSLALIEVIEEYLPGQRDQQVQVLDIGSGPGLPGCILAIARPHWKVTCLDSTQKRIAFIKQAAIEADIKNVRGVAGRCEVLAHSQELRSRFDVVAARAVAQMAVLAELGLPFNSRGGILVAAKSSGAEEEVEKGKPAIEAMGGELMGCVPVMSFSRTGQRLAAVVRKVRDTPTAYPRKNGVPGKRPLGMV